MVVSLTWTLTTGIGFIGAVSGLITVIAYSPLMSFTPNIQMSFLGIGVFVMGVLLMLGGLGRLVSA